VFSRATKFTRWHVDCNLCCRVAQTRHFTDAAFRPRPSARTATVRMMAALLSLMAATPFTAPFPTCSLAVLLSTPGVHAVAAPSSSPVLAQAPDTTGDYSPISMTEEQFKGKQSTVDQSSEFVSHRPGFSRVAITPLASPRTLAHAVLVLRL
jgi:hypothetical protein